MNAYKLSNEQIEVLKRVSAMLEALIKYHEWMDEHGFSNIEFTSIKDVAIAIDELAEATGYDYNFLADAVQEGVDDGETYEEAFKYVCGVSYEKDW